MFLTISFSHLFNNFWEGSQSSRQITDTLSFCTQTLVSLFLSLVSSSEFLHIVCISKPLFSTLQWQKIPKNPSASTCKSTRSWAKLSSQPPEPVNLGSDHSEDFASYQELSHDAHRLNEKALGKQPMKISLKPSDLESQNWPLKLSWIRS